MNNELWFNKNPAAGGYAISRSLRFNSSDSAYLSRTPASAGNRQTWTWAGWVKRSALGTRQGLFGGYDSSVSPTNYTYIEFTGGDILQLESFSNTVHFKLSTTQVFRDCSAWCHLVVAYDSTQGTSSNRLKLYVNGSQVTAFGTASYPSLDYQSGVNTANAHDIGRYPNISQYYLSGYLADIHFIDGQALDPTSFGEFSATTGVWVPKAYTGTYGTNGFHLEFADNSSNTATTLGKDTSGNGNTWTVNNIRVNNSNQVFSSGSSYEGNAILFSGNPQGMFGGSAGNWGVTYSVNDSASLTNGGKVTFPSAITNVSSIVVNCRLTGSGVGKLFVNDNSSGVNVSSTTNTNIDITSALTGSSTPSTFSSFTFGPNSFNIGLRINYVTVNGTILIDSTFNYTNDSLVDVPTNGAQTDTGAGGEVRGNYCTLNPLAKGSSSTLANGNLDLTSGDGYATLGTLAASSGKWYFEALITQQVSGDNGHPLIGVGDFSNPLAAPNSYPGANAAGWSIKTQGASYNGKKMNNATETATNLLFSNGDIVQVAFDVDAGKIWFGRNNTWADSGSPGTGANAAYTNLIGRIGPWIGGYNSSVAVLNFGQRPFAYTAPSGFKALNTANLPAPVVTKPSDLFDVKLYTGTGSTRTISGLGFSPDLVWIKRRDGANAHSLFDIVRGVERRLTSNETSAENNPVTSLVAFNSDGFTLGANTDGISTVNISGQTYVAWAWDAGSSTVTNTAGSISSQVRANASAGFSVVSFTTPASGNYTFGHGLNVAPSLVILKSRGASSFWLVYHSSVCDTVYKYLRLHTTDGVTTDPGVVWGAALPTSTVVGVNAVNSIPTSQTAIAYCFAPVAGYSSFGSYVGNGSSDGVFVYTGFRPRWILTKASSISGQEWFIHDTARDPSNVAGFRLTAEGAFAENTTNNNWFDILSNGFKMRTTNSAANGSGNTYIYAAFAEHPFQYARAR